MKNLVRVTVKELAQILFDTELTIGMPSFASVLQYTAPKLNKKSRSTGLPCKYDNVMKLSKVSIILNSEYEKAVTNQLKKEDKAETDYIKGTNTMPLIFGNNNRFIGLFNGEFVLQYRPNDNIKPKSKYLSNGKLISKNELTDFLQPVKAATNQGTTREVYWRKLYLNNVRKLTFNGVTYKVLHTK